MRNISDACLAKISRHDDMEPAIIVNVWWTDSSFISYSDKKYAQQGLVGKLVEISGIEDVIDINASSSSVNLSVTLDDSDGVIKNIINFNDPHKCFVQVLQWFADLPITDAFILFEGELSSPIIWSEGDRTFKFDVVSMLEDQEVGFSADEAQFNYMPSSLVGKAWPIVFGTVQWLKPLAINEPPSAILASGFGIVNEDAWDSEIINLKKALVDANLNAERAYDLGVGEAITAALYKAFGPGNFPEDPAQAAQHDTAAAGYFAQANQYRQEYEKLNLELNSKLAELDFDKGLEFRVLPITQTNLPSGVSFTAEIGKYTCNALVIGNAIIISNLVEKLDINMETGTSDYNFNTGNGTTSEYNRTKTGSSQKFVWIDGGTSIRVYEFPVQYIVSLGFADVLNVYGTSKYGLALVPSNYYEVTYSEFFPQSGDLVNFSSLRVTWLTIPIPLETLDPDYWQAGQIEVDVSNNDPGTNVVDIMIWAIVNFSGLNYDPASFATVRNQVGNFPATFVLQDRKNVMEFLKDLAFQSRCAIWINNRVFFIQFLPVDGPAIESITDDDVELNSVVITTTETERLVTKFVANYKELVNQSDPDQVILRYNIKNYGSMEETYDFYIYNNYNAVATAAQFWMIRKSNTFKILQCKVALNKLKIEAFDYVNVTFNEDLVATGTVKGQVTKSVFNADDDSLTLEIWLPVRFGEMTTYQFAYPGTTQAVYPPLDDVNIQTGNPYADSHVAMNTNLHFPPATSITFSSRNAPTQGTGQSADAAPIPNNGIITRLPTSAVGKVRPDNLDTKNDTTKRDVLPVTLAVLAQATSNVFFGRVNFKKNDLLYDCFVFTKGLDGTGVELDVKIGLVAANTELPPLCPLVVYRTTWAEIAPDGTAVTKFEYWGQPAVWIPSIQPDPTGDGGSF